MWQAEAAQVAIKLGRMLLPSLRASEEASGLLLEGGTLAKSAKSVSGLPGMSIESAGAEIATLGKVAKPVDMHVSALPELKLRDIDPGTSWKPNGLWTSDKLAWVPKEGPTVHTMSCADSLITSIQAKRACLKSQAVMDFNLCFNASANPLLSLLN